MNKSTLFIIAFAFVLLSSEYVFAQPYKSMFGSSNTSWKFIWRDIWPGPEPDSLYIEKDTTVNGIAYKKLMLSYKPSRYGGGLIREVIDSGKVYFRDIYHSDPFDTTDTVEKLLFRYDLQTGDTFNGNRIDSVVIKDGRRYLYTDNWDYYGYEPLTMIEGIGSNFGFLYNHYFAKLNSQYLLCSYQDFSKTDFINVRFSGNCSAYLSVDETTSFRTEITIYPNPVQDKLYIVNHGNKAVMNIILSGLDGRIYRTLQQGNITMLSLSEIPKGCYLLRLSGEGFQVVKPLLIQ